MVEIGRWAFALLMIALCPIFPSSFFPTCVRLSGGLSKLVACLACDFAYLFAYFVSSLASLTRGRVAFLTLTFTVGFALITAPAQRQACENHGHTGQRLHSASHRSLDASLI
jgi:hypothetical protein